MATSPSSEQIRRAVTDCVAKLMKRSGRAGRVSTDSNVIRDLGLTSEDGVELACMLEAMLNIRIPHDANPLVESTGRKARTIQQVCEAVEAWAASGVPQ